MRQRLRVSVFFVLPWEGIRHVHRLILMYNVLLAQARALPPHASSSSLHHPPSYSPSLCHTHGHTLTSSLSVSCRFVPQIAILMLFWDTFVGFADSSIVRQVEH